MGTVTWHNRPYGETNRDHRKIKGGVHGDTKPLQQNHTSQLKKGWEKWKRVGKHVQMYIIVVPNLGKWRTFLHFLKNLTETWNRIIFYTSFARRATGEHFCLEIPCFPKEGTVVKWEVATTSSHLEFWQPQRVQTWEPCVPGHSSISLLPISFR